MTRYGPLKAPSRSVSVEDPTKSLPEQLDAIANELNLLQYRHTHPEAFLERRDELVVRLRRLARRVAKDPAEVRDLTTYHAPGANQRAPGRRQARTIIVRRL